MYVFPVLSDNAFNEHSVIDETLPKGGVDRENKHTRGLILLPLSLA